jgi:hypothetical protein
MADGSGAVASDGGWLTVMALRTFFNERKKERSMK